MTTKASTTMWLPFFAELSSKVGHHAPEVVAEGSTRLLRLLATRLGAGAIFVEGHLLTRVCDAAVAYSRPPAGARSSHDLLALELLISVLEDLADCASALVTDSPARWRPHVNARVGTVVGALKKCCRSDTRMRVTNRLRALIKQWCSLFTTSYGPAIPVDVVEARQQQILLEAASKSEAMLNETCAELDAATGEMFSTSDSAAAVDRLNSATCHAHFIEGVDMMWCPERESLDIEGASKRIGQILAVPPKSPDDLALYHGVARHLLRHPVWATAEGVPLLGLHTTAMLQAACGPTGEILPTAVEAFCVAWRYASLCDSGSARLLQVFRELCRVVPTCLGLAAKECRCGLIDAPRQFDSSIADEMCLAAALHESRTATAQTASIAMLALCKFAAHNFSLILESSRAATIMLLQSITPHCMTIANENPTLGRGGDRQLSSIHTVLRSLYDTRHVPIGEAAALTLNTAIELGDAVGAEVLDRQVTQTGLSRLVLSTGSSVFPHIRALPCRVVCHLTTTYSQFVSINLDAPSMLIRACEVIASDNAADVEISCAVEWVARVLRVALEEHQPPPIDLGSSSADLPRKLLVRLSQPENSADRVMSLSTAVSAISATQRAAGKRAISVLAPYGQDSAALWTALLKGQEGRLADYTDLLEGAHGTAVDAATLEDCAISTLSSTAAVCEIACLFAEEFVDLVSQTPFAAVLSFVKRALLSPQPSETASALFGRFGGSQLRHPVALQRAYSRAAGWSAKLLRLHLTYGATTTAFPAFDDEMVRGLCTTLQSGDTLTADKSSVVSLLRAAVSLRAHPDLRECMNRHSAALFGASLSVPSNATTTALRCMLVHEFPGANHHASQRGVVTREIQNLSDDFAVAKLDESADSPMLMRLSFVVSHTSCAAAFPLPKKDATLIVEVLLGMANVPRMRNHFVAACNALGQSAEGRFLTLVDIGGAKTVESRSCFAKLALMSFAPRSPELSLAAIDALTSVCRNGDEQAASTLLKMRVIDSVEQCLIEAERKGHPPPTSVMRLLAAASLCEQVQLAVARLPELVTIVVEAAGSPTTCGTLALMVLRNLALHPVAKHQLPQDARVLGVLKRALWPVDELTEKAPSPRPREVSSHAVMAHVDAVEKQLNVYRRQHLAGTAVWSIAHDNQRAKGYLRGAIRASPHRTIADVEERLRAMGDLALLPDFKPAMTAVVESLKALRVGT